MIDQGDALRLQAARLATSWSLDPDMRALFTARDCRNVTAMVVALESDTVAELRTLLSLQEFQSVNVIVGGVEGIRILGMTRLDAAIELDLGLTMLDHCQVADTSTVGILADCLGMNHQPVLISFIDSYGSPVPFEAQMGEPPSGFDDRIGATT